MPNRPILGGLKSVLNVKSFIGQLYSRVSIWQPYYNLTSGYPGKVWLIYLCDKKSSCNKFSVRVSKYTVGGV